MSLILNLQVTRFFFTNVKYFKIIKKNKIVARNLTRVKQCPLLGGIFETGGNSAMLVRNSIGCGVSLKLLFFFVKEPIILIPTSANNNDKTKLLVTLYKQNLELTKCCKITYRIRVIQKC
jgi:hypothetical protein